MAQLASTSYTINDLMYRGMTAKLFDGVDLGDFQTPLFDLLVSRGFTKKIDGDRWDQSIHISHDAAYVIAPNALQARTVATTNVKNTALNGGLVRMITNAQWDSTELNINNVAEKAEEKVGYAVAEMRTSIEAALFGTGNGATALASLRTALPFAITGAYFNIGNDRTATLSANVLHSWANTGSAGTKAFGTTACTKFATADTGALDYSTIAAEVSRGLGYHDFYAFVTARFMKHLRRFLAAQGQMPAMTKPGGPTTGYKFGNATTMSFGADYLEYMGIKFVYSPSNDATYDCILLPMLWKGRPTMILPWKPQTTMGSAKEQVFTLGEKHALADTTNTCELWEANVIFYGNAVVKGLSGCSVITYDGTYA